MRGLVELDGPWLLPRFIAWAVPGLVAAAILWLAFRSRAMMPAILAAATVPVLYSITFIAFFGVGRGMTLALPYAFETVVVFLAVPGVVYAVCHKHR